MAPLNGYMYVKGKSDPETILKKLKKGSKHVTVAWINSGIQSNDQNQLQDYNNSLVPHDPYGASYPYNVPYYNQYNPNYPYYNQYGNHYLDYDHSGQYNEGRTYPDMSFDSQYPARSRRHNSPMSSRRDHSPMNSRTGNIFAEDPLPQFFQSGTGDRANNQPTSHQSSPMSFKKIIKKFFSILVCSKK